MTPKRSFKKGAGLFEIHFVIPGIQWGQVASKHRE